ncbi:MAG TPA: type II secretion system F family protein [Pirellulaceae bacterium]|jgi:type II secretory pathway component PulF
MPQFRYQALNAENQPLAGEILADSVAQAISQLEVAGLTVQSIGYASGQRPGLPPPLVKSDLPQLSTAEQAVLDARMVQIVERGRSLVPALSAYAAEMPSSRSRRQLLDLMRILQSGETSHAAAALSHKPAYWIPLLASAADSGDLCQMLQAFLRDYQPSTESSPRGRGGLVYPVIVVCFAAAVFWFLGIVVIPVFRDLFAGFGLRLPELTQGVLSFYAAITNVTFVGIVVAVGIVAFIVSRILRTAAGGRASGHVARPPGRSAALVQFSRYLAELLDADFEPASSLRLASSAVDRPRLKMAAWRMASQIEAGGLVESVTDRRTVTASVLHAVTADLPRRARTATLREISQCHAERGGAAPAWTQGAFEPISILVVGFLVAMTVIGLYLPLLSLIQALS